MPETSKGNLDYFTPPQTPRISKSVAPSTEQKDDTGNGGVSSAKKSRMMPGPSDIGGASLTLKTPNHQPSPEFMQPGPSDIGGASLTLKTTNHQPSPEFMQALGQTENQSSAQDRTCSQCNRSFVRHRDLKRHVSTVHGENIRFPCPCCYRSFSRKDSLKRHTKHCSC
ncbi:uncharacterized protein [Ptychodera flava]|uniref:uncharacterized protein n=1 Tax=Ptychodera flava TaxID=63121 RepID=UPI00396A121C